jgi:hypothetical protein
MEFRRRLILAGATGGMLCSGLATTAAGVAAATPITHSVAQITGRTATGWTSGNWSGYAGTTAGANQVSGDWTVPAVSKTSGNTYSSTWIGIDGFTNSDLIQTGTEQDWVGGKAKYDAWWEILPAPETLISMTVKPGDAMEADIHFNGSQWLITIEDVSESESFSILKNYTGPGASVEWIQEATQINGVVATEAHYSPYTFSNCGFDGGGIAFTTGNRGVMVQKGKQVSTPSNPGKAGNDFNMKYGKKTPKAP